MAAKKGAWRKFGALQTLLQHTSLWQAAGESVQIVQRLAPPLPASLNGQLSQGASAAFNDMMHSITAATSPSSPPLSTGAGAGLGRAGPPGDVQLNSIVERSGNKGRLLDRVQKSRVQDWAREGFRFMMEAGTDCLPWDAIAEGKLSAIELPARLNQRQVRLVVSLSWV